MTSINLLGIILLSILGVIVITLLIIFSVARYKTNAEFITPWLRKIFNEKEVPKNNH